MIFHCSLPLKVGMPCEERRLAYSVTVKILVYMLSVLTVGTLICSWTPKNIAHFVDHTFYGQMHDDFVLAVTACNIYF